MELVTTMHREDTVEMNDLPIFGLSFVRAVLKLHLIGILHCDVKPGNVLSTRLYDWWTLAMPNLKRRLAPTKMPLKHPSCCEAIRNPE
jgi:serine/threonine protein kinase